MSNFLYGLCAGVCTLLTMGWFNSPSKITHNKQKTEPSVDEIDQIMNAFNESDNCDKVHEDGKIYLAFKGIGDSDDMNGKDPIRPFPWLINRISGMKLCTVLNPDQFTKIFNIIIANPKAKLNIIGWSLGGPRALFFLEELEEKLEEHGIKLEDRIEKVFVGDIHSGIFSIKGGKILQGLEDRNQIWFFRAKEDNFANNNSIIRLFSDHIFKADYECP